MKWTKNQQKAIDTRNKSLLVSAAAGSGKTAILIERIVKLIIKDKVQVNQLLVVTFTRAAAEEMRARLYAALRKISAKSKEERAFINKQLINLSSASIRTLHSFCLDIIKNYYQIIDLDPSLSIGDENQIAMLKDKAMEQLLDEQYKREDAIFIKLLEMFNNKRDDRSIKEIIDDLHKFIVNRPEPVDWAQNALEYFTLNLKEFNKSIFYREFYKNSEKRLISAKEYLSKAMGIVKDTGDKKSIDILRGEIIQVKTLLENLEEGYEDFYSSLLKAEFSTLRLKKDIDEEAKKIIKGYRDLSKDIVNSFKKDLEFHQPAQMLKELEEMKTIIELLVDLVLEYNEIFNANKIDKGIMDFNDIEHYTLAILKNLSVAGELRERYKYIFVDEYQDSNEIQDYIIEKIKNEDNLFFVGDVKQSIYRFRMADPTLFLKKEAEFKSSDRDLEETITLNQNFRSREKVIDFINLIFDHIMSDYVGEVNYDDEAKLYLGLSQQSIEDEVSVNIIEYEETLEEDDLAELSKIELEALFVANKIKKLLSKEIYSKETGEIEKTKYKDITILLRTTKKWADTYYEVLNNQGIPVYAESQTGYFDTLEIRLLVELMQVIDNLRQDIPLIGVMRSPIFSFTMEEITAIRAEYKAGAFYDAVITYNEDAHIVAKIDNMLQDLEKYKKMSKYMPIHDFLWKAVIDTGYYYYISALPAGEQRLANVRALIDRAKKYSESNIKGLFNFIQLIESIKETKKDLTSAKIMSPYENVVKIMSIHKSKGLEFPIVFIGGMGKKMNMQDIAKPIIVHKDLGICPNYVSIEERRYCPTVFKTIAKEKITIETLSEEMRILYVAMTRARDNLYLVGTIDNLDKYLEKIERQWMNQYQISKCRTYLDWIMPVLLKEKSRDIFQVNYYERREIEEEIKEERKTYKESILNHWKYLEDNTNIDPLISKKLNWEYPYRNHSLTPAKMSVTEINTKEHANLIKINNTLNKPKFIDEREISGVERGNILHEIMQYIDFNIFKKQDLVNFNAIKEEVSRIASKYCLNMHDDKYYIDKIMHFLNNKLAHRIINANEIYRERAFNYKIELDDSSDYVLVQGIIDLFFKEKNHFILIDYKSDYYNDEYNRQKIIDKYMPQINLYKNAIKDITGRNIKETYLYLFHGNEEIRI